MDNSVGGGADVDVTVVEDNEDDDVGVVFLVVAAATIIAAAAITDTAVIQLLQIRLYFNR